MLYSFPNLKPVRYSMTSSNCCFLTRMQVSQETGKVVWYSRLSLRIFQFVVIYTVKNFSVVNRAEVDVFLKLPCFLHDPSDVSNLIIGSSASLKPSLYIWKFLVHVLLKPSLKDFKQMTFLCIFNLLRYMLPIDWIKNCQKEENKSGAQLWTWAVHLHPIRTMSFGSSWQPQVSV